MSDHRPVFRASEHDELAALIPWYVNETLGDADRSRLEAHLPSCAACRADLVIERRIRDGMSVDGPLEFMPAASLNRLRLSLDADLAGLPAQAAEPPSRTRMRGWQWLTAASLAGAVVTAGLLTAGHWLTGPRDSGAAVFHTVTDATPHPREEVVRAVFAPTITLVELQGLLDEAQLRIISGPTEAGVYSLASRSNLPVSTSLALLRRHAAVRFAESTAPTATSAAGTSRAP